MIRLLEELQHFLIEAGVVRSPSDANADPQLPPMWLQPRAGAVGPGQGSPPGRHDSTVLSAFFSGGRPTDPYEGFVELRVVDLRFRTMRSPDAEDLWYAIRGLVDDKRGYDLASLHVEESLTWRRLQLIDSAQDLGYDFVASLLFLVRQASYA